MIDFKGKYESFCRIKKIQRVKNSSQTDYKRFLQSKASQLLSFCDKFVLFHGQSKS
jgi:hypothetical protein